MSKYLAAFALVTLIALSATVCLGQPLKLAPVDAIQQQEMGNLNVGDGFIHMTNSGANSGTPTQAAITVQVYTFDAGDAQLISCCSCKIVPDGGAFLSGRNDLISNTLTPAVPSSITVKLVATKGGNAATDQRVYGSPGFSAGLRATRLSTHLAASYPGVPANFVTEAAFSNVPVSDSEYTRMVQSCAFIQNNGSGFGICRSCRIGTNNAVFNPAN
jgi:hypothetical protein